MVGGTSSSECSLTNDGGLEFKGTIRENKKGESCSTCRVKDCEMGITAAHKGVRITYRTSTTDCCIFKFKMVDGRAASQFSLQIAGGKDESPITR